jgi:sporulation protein YlmC with PRC-barrel domain
MKKIGGTSMSKMIDFRHKEVINICDAKRLGCVCDVDIDFCTGTVIDCDGGFNVRCL